MKKRFDCEIDCAACAAKVEDAVRAIEGVESVRVNFLTQKFTFEAADERFDALLDEALKIGRKIEPDFSIAR